MRKAICSTRLVWSVSYTHLDAELDPIYFTGKTGTYTFTPETEDVSVSVANPTIGNDALSFSGFKALAAEKDGSYNVPLTNGRNIVKLEKDGKAEYQVITAKHVTVKVNGQDLDQAVVAPGEKVSVTFDTLFNPVTRMRLYNTCLLYTSATGLAGTAVEADASQSSFQVETTAGDVSGAVGDVVEIPVKISTKQALRGFSGKLSGNYDENILEFQGLDTKELPADAMVSS